MVFLYGIKNRLPHLMDAGAPAVYRDVKRENLLEICDTHGILYAWVSCLAVAVSHNGVTLARQIRYQLLWDRIIEEACEIITNGQSDLCSDCAIGSRSYSVPEERVTGRIQQSWESVHFTSVMVCAQKARQLHEHYDGLRSLHWIKNRVVRSGSPKYYCYHRVSDEPPESPKVSYLEFVRMLGDHTAIDDSQRCLRSESSCKSDKGSAQRVVKYVNDTIKEKIEDMPKFSSFLDESQKDGDDGFEQDGLDSEEEPEDGSV